MTNEQFIRLFFIALLLFIVYQVFLIFTPFTRTIFWAAILTFAFFPLYRRIRSLLAPRETIAAGVTTLLILLTVIPPVVYIIVSLTTQAIDLYQLASDYVRQGRLAELITYLREIPAVKRIELQSPDVWNLIQKDGGEWLLSTSRSLGNFAALQLASLTKNILFIIINILLMSVLIFIFLKDGEKIYNFVFDAAPLEEKNKRSLFTQVSQTFEAVIRGQIFTALAQGIISGFLFFFLGIPLPVLFATALFFAAMIPITGAATIWFPLAAFLYLTHNTTKAVILFLFGALVISLMDNVMKPAIIGERTKLPYFLLFFGILGGLKIYGLMGIFLAPVILSLFFAMIQIYREKNW